MTLAQETAYTLQEVGLDNRVVVVTMVGSDAGAAGRVADLFKALAEQRRVAILWLVRDRELPAGEIAKHFNTTRQAISQHLGVLTAVGLLQLRREGTKRLYRTNEAAITEIRSYLDGFWDDRLLSLKREIEKDKMPHG